MTRAVPVPDAPPELGRACSDCGTFLTPANTARCLVSGCTGQAHRYGPPCGKGIHRIYCHDHQPKSTPHGRRA